MINVHYYNYFIISICKFLLIMTRRDLHLACTSSFTLHYTFLFQVDVELAKQQANKPDEDDLELRKKLWLRIGLYRLTLDFVCTVLS